jgi:hypothetical protein
MSRVYFCRLKNCQHPPVNGGPPPDNWCPSCEKITLWRTEPWIFISLDSPKGYVLTEKDREFLLVQKIKPE